MLPTPSLSRLSSQLRLLRQRLASPSCVGGLLAGALLASGAIASSSASAAETLVRWHGDYYQWLWDHSTPSGTPKEILENRNLRGGEREAALFKNIGIDADNDGQNDDTHLYYEFSLDERLNPPGTPARPNGVYYHEDMPSAKFYGGLSATYYNLKATNFGQAFVENDGAGGDVMDVGYPSPYGADQYAGLREYNAKARNADGRYSKWHLGPHEDIAIAIYDPNYPMALDPTEDHSDNLTTFHAAFVWKKEDFLNGGAGKRVSVGHDSAFSFESTRWWGGVGEVRWLIQDADNQFYISQFNVQGELDYFGHKNELIDPLSTLWAPYNPAVDNLDFNQNASNLVWIDPEAAGLFDDVQSFGLYLEQDTPTLGRVYFSMDEIQFLADVNDTQSVLTPPGEENNGGGGFTGGGGGGVGGGDPQISPVPEASSWLAFVGVVGYLSRRSRGRNDRRENRS
ncbi:MAG: hypothetical protein KDA61_13935 [Planctomycetales bacterium]|nr:hypothetical protein [Planctomycetales bacterium]